MKIVQRTSPNFAEGRDTKAVSLIVVHHMVGTLEGADRTFQDKARKTSAHYGVAGDGRVWNWVSEGDTAFHAGNWDINQRSIGIEHEDLGKDDFTDLEYATSAQLIRDIANRHNLVIDEATVIPHNRIVATACPGSLDIKRLIRQAIEGESNVACKVDRPISDLIEHGFLLRPTTSTEFYNSVKDQDIVTVMHAQLKSAERFYVVDRFNKSFTFEQQVASLKKQMEGSGNKPLDSYSVEELMRAVVTKLGGK